MTSTAVQPKECPYFDQWKTILEMLRSEFGEATFQSWFKHLHFSSVEGSELVLTVPTRFIRQWVRNHYLARITQLCKERMTSIFSVDLLVRSLAANDAAPITPATANGVEIGGRNIDVLDVPQDHVGSPLDRRFNFDTYIIGESNQLAHSAALAVAESNDVLAGNNPLYIYGGVGLGKTHLMHAIAWRMHELHPQKRVVYLSAERFMYQFVQSLRNKDVMAFKEAFRCIDVLIVDDIQFICGKTSTQEEFQHTCNALLDCNKKLIIAGDRSPAELEGMSERIRSRLGWGLVLDIKQPDYRLRLEILQSKLLQMRDVTVPENVLEFLANRITSSSRELEGALNKVVAHSALTDKAITLPSCQLILADLLRANEKVLTIMSIQKMVASFYDIKMTDMASKKRARCVARPRQVAMYLAKHHTSRSLSEIGRKFGGKDHTTVMHAVKRIESLRKEDSEFNSEIERLEHSLIV